MFSRKRGGFGWSGGEFVPEQRVDLGLGRVVVGGAAVPADRLRQAFADGGGHVVEAAIRGQRGAAGDDEREPEQTQREGAGTHCSPSFFTSFIPQIGHLPGSAAWTSGCIGQVQGPATTGSEGLP